MSTLDVAIEPTQEPTSSSPKNLFETMKKKNNSYMQVDHGIFLHIYELDDTYYFKLFVFTEPLYTYLEDFKSIYGEANVEYHSTVYNILNIQYCYNTYEKKSVTNLYTTCDIQDKYINRIRTDLKYKKFDNLNVNYIDISSNFLYGKINFKIIGETATDTDSKYISQFRNFITDKFKSYSDDYIIHNDDWHSHKYTFNYDVLTNIDSELLSEEKQLSRFCLFNMDPDNCFYKPINRKTISIMSIYNIDNYSNSSIYTINVRSLSFFPEFKIIDLKTEFFTNNAPHLFNNTKETSAEYIKLLKNDLDTITNIISHGNPNIDSAIKKIDKALSVEFMVGENTKNIYRSPEPFSKTQTNLPTISNEVLPYTDSMDYCNKNNKYAYRSVEPAIINDIYGSLYENSLLNDESITNKINEDILNVTYNTDDIIKIFVNVCKDDHRYVGASTTINHIIDLFNRYKIEKYNKNNIGKKLVELGVKKTRKYDGCYYGIDTTLMPKKQIEIYKQIRELYENK
jgi:hypothetical protein